MPNRCQYGCPPSCGHYTASDGSVWHPTPIDPPIPVRSADWCAVRSGHEEIAVYGATREECVEAVEEWVREQA